MLVSNIPYILWEKYSKCGNKLVIQIKSNKKLFFIEFIMQEQKTENTDVILTSGKFNWKNDLYLIKLRFLKLRVLKKH